MKLHGKPTGPRIGAGTVPVPAEMSARVRRVTAWFGLANVARRLGMTDTTLESVRGPGGRVMPAVLERLGERLPELEKEIP